MFDGSYFGFKLAWVLGVVFIIMIFYFFMRHFFLGKCDRCGRIRSPGAKFCSNCGTQYE
ncbi:hypothetical protein D1AOALGA4SA_5192 [Olavius algarvensis Delta 1 endosymbiont]|nr:hypothetical protein D1AOALGA4SA_5192 [Olavius algarvensis Delta 1 endosymbiont]